MQLHVKINTFHHKLLLIIENFDKQMTKYHDQDLRILIYFF